MAQQMKILELPFNQLELAQLELFLNREREANWVLVKIEKNRFYFEKRTGEAYCYQVRLFIVPHGLEKHLLSVEEKQKKWIKEQEQVGWQYMGELSDWYVFRSLVERHPVVIVRDLKEEYKTLRQLFFERELRSILGRSIILVGLLVSIIIFAPMAFITSNYTLGIILTSIMLILLAMFEMKMWWYYKYYMRKRMQEGKQSLPTNEQMIRDSKKRLCSRYIVAGGALVLFSACMLLDGIFLKSFKMVLMTLMISGVFIGGFIETLGEKHFKPMHKRCGQIMYIGCLVGLVVIGIYNGLNNLQEAYVGEKAVKVKTQVKERGLMTLEIPGKPTSADYLSVVEKESRTLFLKHYIQYIEWQGDSYLDMNYYDVREKGLSEVIFKFLLKVKSINEENGYESVNPTYYGADEAYLGYYSRSLYLRKDMHIIEIHYTSEKLDDIYWRNRICEMMKQLTVNKYSKH